MVKVGRKYSFTESLETVYMEGDAKWVNIVDTSKSFGKFVVNLENIGPEAVQEIEAKLARVEQEAVAYFNENEGKYEGIQDNFSLDSENQKVLKVYIEEVNKTTGKTETVPVYDKDGKEIKDFKNAGISIGNGSRIKVKMGLRPYYLPTSKKAGIRKTLFAIQILELKEQERTDAGFTAVEDKGHGEF